MRKDDRGGSAIEFALLAPILVMQLLGAIECARAIWLQHSLQYATGQAARCAATSEAVCGTVEQTQIYAASLIAGTSVQPSAFSLSDATCGKQVGANMLFTAVVVPISATCRPSPVACDSTAHPRVRPLGCVSKTVVVSGRVIPLSDVVVGAASSRLSSVRACLSSASLDFHALPTLARQSEFNVSTMASSFLKAMVRSGEAMRVRSISSRAPWGSRPMPSNMAFWLRVMIT